MHALLSTLDRPLPAERIGGLSAAFDGSAAGGHLTIDLAAIRANYRSLRERLGSGTAAGVVKADAYGLGALHVAPALAAEGCRHFFVAHLGEGVALRSVLPTEAEIFVLNGVLPGTEPAALEARLMPVLNSLDQVDGWADLARRTGRWLPSVLQVDSGMSRLGLAPGEVDLLAAEPGRLAGLEPRLVMSHLACADESGHAANREQLAAFHALRARLPAAPASFANSAGIFLGPDFHFDLARPGAALYGLRPVAGLANPMQPVIRLEARVVQIRKVPAGTAVGYGYSFRTSRETRIVTISVGYADGWVRSLGNAGSVWFGDVALPIVGRVSMDSITVDATALPAGALLPGAAVELIGPHQPADAVADHAGTIGYEILTSLGPRYHRTYLGA